MQTYEIVNGFFNALAALGYFYVVMYIFQVENANCVCAASWKQSFILYASSILLTLSFINVYACATGMYSKLVTTYPFYDKMVLLMSMIYIGISYAYINELKKRDCNCSKDLYIVLIVILQFLNGLLVTYGVLFIIGVVLGSLWLLYHYSVV